MIRKRPYRPARPVDVGDMTFTSVTDAGTIDGVRMVLDTGDDEHVWFFDAGPTDGEVTFEEMEMWINYPIDGFAILNLDDDDTEEPS